MAEINGSGSVLDASYYQHDWVGLGNGDTGVPLGRGALSDKSVHVFGTFGTGGTVVIEGSMNGTDWVTLTDPQGNALSLTTADLSVILQTPRLVRPNVTAGDGSTSLNVSIGARSRA